MAEELQLNMLFHIDDLLLSHAGPEIVTDHAKKLGGTHGNKETLAVTRKNTHKNLVMTIDFR